MWVSGRTPSIYNKILPWRNKIVEGSATMAARIPIEAKTVTIVDRSTAVVPAKKVCGLSVGEFKGSGVTGNIYSVTYEGKLAVLKRLEHGDNGIFDPIEIDLHFRLSHPHILHGKGLVLNPTACGGGRIGLILPVGAYSLHDMIKDNGRMFSSLTMSNPHEILRMKLDIFYKISTAVAFLHQNDLIHADLKPLNIIMRGGEPTLSDFGLAREMPRDLHELDFQTDLITYSYRGPENIEGKTSNVYGYYSDVWSMGMILYNMLRNQDPYINADYKKDIERRLNSGVFIRVTEVQSYLPGTELKTVENIADLLNRILIRNKQNRLHMSDVLNHPLFIGKSVILGRQSFGPDLALEIAISRDPANRAFITSGIKLIIELMRSVKGIKHTTSGLFLAIDIFMRTLSLSVGVTKVLPYHCIVSCSLADKVTAVYSGEVFGFYLGREETKERMDVLSRVELNVIDKIGGIINRHYLFRASEYLSQARSILSLALHNPELYHIVNIVKWTGVTAPRDPTRDVALGGATHLTSLLG